MSRKVTTLAAAVATLAVTGVQAEQTAPKRWEPTVQQQQLQKREQEQQQMQQQTGQQQQMQQQNKKLKQIEMNPERTIKDRIGPGPVA
ncbi:MAG: hypothetical protein Kow0096_18240 [Thiohalomonadaceae bacterium]